MERRKYERIPTSMFVFVRHDGGEAVGDVVNASMNGIVVNTSNTIPIGTDVDIHIKLDGKTAAKSIGFCGKVARKDSKKTAIHIETIDMDSFLVWHNMVNRFQKEAPDRNGTRQRKAS